MAKTIDKQTMLDLIVEAKRTDPETGSFAEWLAEYLAEHLPTLTPPNEWVSVKNKKPELGERVLATDGAFVGEGYMDCYGVWCRPNGMRWNMLESEVTHWMPLPAPPDRRPPEQIDMLERMESE